MPRISSSCPFAAIILAQRGLAPAAIGLVLALAAAIEADHVAPVPQTQLIMGDDDGEVNGNVL